MKKRLTLKLTIFICLILAGLAFTVYPRLKNPDQVQAATSASKTITITNTGSEQTNYDVLVEVDTASPISAGNMQSDCDDIRLYDSNDTTALSYWIESGCNTTTTQLWVRVPTVPNGAKEIYLHYNDPAMTNGEQSWSGNFILMSNTNCPSGWTRNTNFDSRFPYGASSYGGTGGASSHSHSGKTITSGGGSGGGSPDGPGRPAANHTHNLTITGSSTTALPPYLNMVFCQKTDLDINSGLIALFDASVPSGWTRFTALDSRFPQGASSYGGTGGSTTHTHTITHGSVSGSSHSSGAGGSKRDPACPDSHIHTWSNTTSGSTSNLPPYLNMVFGSQNSTGVGSANMISMFTALPPLGWTRFSTLDSRFPYGATTYGETGGASSHTNSASGTSGGPSSNATYCASGSHGTYSSSTHAHSYSTTTNSASSLPPYLNTIFGKRNDPASIGITAVPGNSCNPGINDTTHTITADCSFQTSRGTDTNSKTVYGMDPGTDSANASVLTVQAGTLTITDASNIVLGSISMTGGSIAINTGGQITVGGGIYYEDADADDYPDSLTIQVAHTTPTDKRRRNLMTTTTTTDCNNSDGTKYRNLTGYTDSDADSYGTGNSQQVCSGSTLASGYADNGDDCDDSLYSTTNYCQGGTGNDGNCVISSNTNINTGSCIGRTNADGVNFNANSTNSGQNQITLTSTPTGLSAEDDVLIIDLQGGSSVGNYELKNISSINSSTLTFTENLTHSYDGGSIMIQRVPNYSSVTINSGTNFYPSAWNGSKGGVLIFKNSEDTTIQSNGAIHVNGYGFSGGTSVLAICCWAGTRTSYQGNSYLNNGTQSQSANGNAGGGGYAANQNAVSGGGGGGYSSAGTTGGGGNCGSVGGNGGNSLGSADLSSIYLGAGGGAGAGTENGLGGTGGNGGGIIIIYSNTLTNNGTISANGSNGYTPTYGGGGGGGSGGSILIDALSITQGTITANGASGGSPGSTGGGCVAGAGGNSSSGRIKIN